MSDTFVRLRNIAGVLYAAAFPAWVYAAGVEDIGVRSGVGFVLMLASIAWFLTLVWLLVLVAPSMTASTFVCAWTNRAGNPVGRAEFDTEAAAERHAAWKRSTEGGKAVVWCRGGVEVA